MRLMKDNLLPPWALFAFTDFKHASPALGAASEVALIGEHFILLAPEEIDGGFEGLLLAEHETSGQQLQATYQELEWQVQVPEFDGFVIAKAGIQLDALSSPPA